jgi:hypothetical protein
MTRNEKRLFNYWQEFIDSYEGAGFSYQFIKQSQFVAPVGNVMRLMVPIRPLAQPFIYIKVQKEFEQWLKEKHNWKIKLYFHVVVWNEELGESEMLIDEANKHLLAKMN